MFGGMVLLQPDVTSSSTLALVQSLADHWPGTGQQAARYDTMDALEGPSRSSAQWELLWQNKILKQILLSIKYIAQGFKPNIDTVAHYIKAVAHYINMVAQYVNMVAQYVI